MNNHLTPQQMLAFTDGELSKSEMRRAKEHLHSCWTCLTAMERLKSDIATILDAQNESFAPGLPPLPQPWPGFQTVLVGSLPAKPVSVWVRFEAYFRTFSPVRILVVSGIVTVLLVWTFSVFRIEPVSAKELLWRIQVADTQRSKITKDQVIRERVRIRKTTHGRNYQKLVSVEAWKSPTATYWDLREGDSAAADLEAHYRAHDIPMGLPLSAASVESWGNVAGGNPMISRQGSQVELSFAGSADGAANSLERVSLSVQPDTWQVKQMTLDFSDALFEVIEDDYSVIPTNAVPADLLAHLEPEVVPPLLARAASGIAATSIRLPTVNLDKTELDVLARLHSVKADLGEPVTVTRSGPVVKVGAWQLPPDRQNQLRAALADEPGVRVELNAPRVPLKSRAVAPAAASPPATTDAPVHIEVASGNEDPRLLKYFGSSLREQDFTNEALGTSTIILAHLYALRNLQGQFPVERSQSLGPEEQTQLHSLVQDHGTAISANIDALGRQLAPLEANLGVPACGKSPTPAVANWQGGSLEALATAKRVDHLLRALLTNSQAAAAPDSALPEINQNLCRLRTELRLLNGQMIN